MLSSDLYAPRLVMRLLEAVLLKDLVRGKGMDMDIPVDNQLVLCQGLDILVEDNLLE